MLLERKLDLVRECRSHSGSGFGDRGVKGEAGDGSRYILPLGDPHEAICVRVGNHWSFTSRLDNIDGEKRSLLFTYHSAKFRARCRTLECYKATYRVHDSLFVGNLIKEDVLLPVSTSFGGSCRHTK